MVTRGWWQRFCERNKQLCHRTAVPFLVQRAIATDADVLDRYFSMLMETFTENGVLNRASQIYNCDETGLPLGAYNNRVVAKVGSNPCCITTNTKTQVTVLACVSAAGITMPPFVIFKRKTVNQELASGEVPGTLYGLSENGWMTRKLFIHYHFLSYAPKARPIVLLMDGHSTHYCPETIHTAAANQVILCQARHMRDARQTTVREISQMLGSMVAAHPGILPAPLHYRQLERTRSFYLRQGWSFDDTVTVPVSSPMKLELSWWTDKPKSSNGRPLQISC